MTSFKVSTEESLRNWVLDFEILMKSKHLSQIRDMLADNVKFYHPFARRPSDDMHIKDYIMEVLKWVTETFEDFKYTEVFRIDLEQLGKRTISAHFKCKMISRRDGCDKDKRVSIEGEDTFTLNDRGEIITLNMHKLCLCPYDKSD